MRSRRLRLCLPFIAAACAHPPPRAVEPWQSELIPEAEARALVESHAIALEACVAGLAPALRSKGGELRAELNIRPDGTVAAIEQVVTHDAAVQLRTCFEREIATWVLRETAGPRRAAITVTIAPPVRDAKGDCLAPAETLRALPRPEPAEDPATPKGVLRPAIVDAFIARQIAPAIQDCYARALRRTRTLAGHLVVGFVVDEEGRVRSESVTLREWSQGLDALQDCIVAVVADQAFPVPERPGNVDLAYRFDFRPGPPGGLGCIRADAPVTDEAR